MVAHNPQHLAFFDRVLGKIAEHKSYAQAVRTAAADGRQLVLNYHTHGDGQGYCASICALEGETPDLGGLLRLPGELQELAHIRGVGQSEEECGVLMDAFAALLRERYRLGHDPQIYLDGRPWQGPRGKQTR